MRTFFVLVGLALAGCGPKTTENNGTDAGSGDMVVVQPVHCSGTFSGAATGSFADCTISMTEEPGDEMMNLIPSALSTSPFQMLQLVMIMEPRAEVKHYNLANLGDGTRLTALLKGSLARYTAERADSVNISGTVDLTLTAAPVFVMGTDTWNDMHAHGTLSATLPLDPNSPGTPGTMVRFDATF